MEKNYFATVIQKIFRGYYLRKSDFKKKLINANVNINSIYIKKRAKDNKYLFGNAFGHRKCPTEENLDILCYKSNKREPPKIKEIVIFRSTKKITNNSPFKYKEDYIINSIYNEPISSHLNYNKYLEKCKLTFKRWKEYIDKKKIICSIKKMKKFEQKNNNHFYNSAKKDDKNFMNNNIIKKQFYI